MIGAAGPGDLDCEAEALAEPVSEGLLDAPRAVALVLPAPEPRAVVHHPRAVPESVLGKWRLRQVQSFLLISHEHGSGDMRSQTGSAADEGGAAGEQEHQQSEERDSHRTIG